jgi:hypothetical protein
VKEDVTMATENVAQEVEKSIETKIAPWPAWVGVAVLVLGIILIAAFSRKRTTRTITTVTRTETAP